MLDGAWGVLLQSSGLSRGGLPRRALRGSSARPAEQPGRAQPDAAGRRARGARELLRRGRRHRDHEHVHRDVDRPGRLRARRCGLRPERRRRAHRARGRRATGSSPARSARSTSRSRSARASTTPASARTRSTQVVEAYAEQIRGLADGGVDLLLIETIFDTLNCKAAIVAAREVAPQLPLWISVTIVDLSGRTLTGQTIDSFWTAIEHAEPLIVGINCSLGANEMRPYVADLSRVATCLTSCHPNAGLPNAFGGYDETPDVTSTLLREFAQDGLLNIAGSCCGSTPEHTRAIAEAVRGLEPRTPVSAKLAQTRFSGLETFEIGPDTGLRPDRRAHERDRLGAVPPHGRGRRLRLRGQRRARAGARRREPPRREHGRRPARRRGGDDARS